MSRIWNYVSSFIGTRKAESSKARLGRRRSIRPEIERLESRLNPAKVVFSQFNSTLVVEPVTSEVASLTGVRADLLQIGSDTGLDLSDTNYKLICESWYGPTYLGQPEKDWVIHSGAPTANSLPANSWIQLYLDNSNFDVNSLKVDYKYVYSSEVRLQDFNPANKVDIGLWDSTNSTVAAKPANTFTVGKSVVIPGDKLGASSFTTNSTNNPLYVNRLLLGLEDAKVEVGGDLRFNSLLAVGAGEAVTVQTSASLKAGSIVFNVDGSISKHTSSPLGVSATNAIDIKTTNDDATLQAIGKNTFNSLNLGNATAFLFGEFQTKGAEKISNQTVVNI